MYCCKKSITKTMPTDVLLNRQELYAEVLPKWEDRIFRLATEVFPKVDQRLMGLDDIQQELRIALWEAILSFDLSWEVTITTWVFKILKQASGLIAKLQYHKMPHSIDGHAVQLLPLADDSDTTLPSDDGEFEGYKAYKAPVPDPDAIRQIEIGVEKDECIKTIRPALKEGFEQSVFDLFMLGYTGGDIVRELGLNPKRGGAARVSSVKLKIKIAGALINSMPLENVSAAQSAEYLAGRMRHRLSSTKQKETEPEERPPNMCPQLV